MTTLKPQSDIVIKAIEFETPSNNLSAKKFKLNKSHYLLLVIAAATLLFIGLISFAKSISVSVLTVDLENPNRMLPISAQVQFDSLLKLPIANRVMLLPGAHRVSVTSQGYRSFEKKIEVGGDRQQAFDLILTPNPGSLTINLTPVISAKVSVDSVATPLIGNSLIDLAAGKRVISVDAPLYRTITKEVLINGKGEEQEIDLALEAAWGELSLQSLPGDASVMIDDVHYGQTPASLKVEEGNHELVLQLAKYKPVKRSFTIQAGEQLVVPPIELVSADAVLSITTKPTDAAVVLGGVYQGNSPIEVIMRPDQAAVLQVYKAGFRLHESTIELTPEQVDKQELSLSQDLVSVRFSISPADADLYIDDVKQARGLRLVALDTLPHRISVRKAGHVPYNNVVVPTKNAEQVVSVNLLTNQQAFWASLPEIYQTQAGQSMKLFKSPGAVQMGSARSETGRRSNEVRYQAELKKHFYVSLHEVTNKQFRRYSASHSSGNYKGKSLDSGKHPVANVSWQQAALYCNWLSEKEGLEPFYATKSGYVAGNKPEANGYRLLTEAEWAWLARNKNDGVLRYVWGNTARPAPNTKVGNYADINAADFIAFSIANYNDGYKASSPIGRFPANHRGLYDMGGNAAEWVNDWYSALSEYKSLKSPLIDPLGPDIGEFHVIRGASWARGHLPQVRLAYRDFGAKGKYEVGFRIARYVGEPK